jgi:hypothetical protein
MGRSRGERGSWQLATAVTLPNADVPFGRRRERSTATEGAVAWPALPARGTEAVAAHVRLLRSKRMRKLLQLRGRLETDRTESHTLDGELRVALGVDGTYDERHAVAFFHATHESSRRYSCFHDRAPIAQMRKMDGRFTPDNTTTHSHLASFLTICTSI